MKLSDFRDKTDWCSGLINLGLFTWFVLGSSFLTHSDTSSFLSLTAVLPFCPHLNSAVLMLDFCILGLAPIWSSDQQSSQGHNEPPLLIPQRAVQEASLKRTQIVEK